MMVGLSSLTWPESSQSEGQVRLLKSAIIHTHYHNGNLFKCIVISYISIIIQVNTNTFSRVMCI